MRRLPPMLALLLTLTGFTTRAHAQPHTHALAPAVDPSGPSGIASPDAPFTAGPFTLPEGHTIDEVLASWFVLPVADAAARLELQVSTGGETSPWLTVARWGDRDALASLPAETIDSPAALANIDVLECRTPARSVRVRVLAAAGPVEVRGLWLTLTDAAEQIDPSDAKQLDSAPPAPLELAVPFHAQSEAGPELASRLCSPTSISMLLGHAGHARPVAVVAALAYDPDADIYGNWINNTLTASLLGAPTLVTRLASWHELELALAHGPVALSLPPFTPDTLAGVTYTSTSGHLLVARGFDDRGDVIVSDPAHADRAEAETAYSRADLTRLWLLQNRGTCYLPAGAVRDVLDARNADRLP